MTSSTISDEAICGLCGHESICGGIGVVRQDLPVGDPDFGKLFPCPHRPIDPARVQTLRSVGNLDAYGAMTFDSFFVDEASLNPTQAASLHQAYKMAVEYAEAPHDWLMFQGGYGCGKTHLAAAIGNHRLRYESPALFITAPDLLDHLRRTYGADADISYDALFERIKATPLMIIDDLGSENPSPWAQEKLFQLLNYRYVRRLPTVITTNADLEQIDPRLRSRLMDDRLNHRVIIHAPDYRTSQPDAREQLSALSLHADMTFDSFETAADGDDGRNLDNARQIASAYASRPQGWLMLMGGYGVGKTHLAAAIAHAHQARGQGVIFLSAPDLLDHLRRTFEPGAPVSFDRSFQTFRMVDLLVLDDLGSENPSAWAQEKLFQILNYRYVAHKPTVVTTSRTLEQIDARLRLRLLDTRRVAVFAITATPYVMRQRNRYPRGR